jgi:hypothetical protein
MTKFRDYSVEDTIESVTRALSNLEPYNSIREGDDEDQKP